MNKLLLALLVISSIILFLFFLCLGFGEYIRQTCTLQKLPDVNTKNSSFSLTTIPSRINEMEPTIESLVKQNPKTIYLNVPFKFKKTGENYVIPEWLDKYTNTGEVTLIRPEDKGPATKFLGLFEYKGIIEPDEYICIVDDDQIYNENLLSNLIKKADKFNGERVISVLVELTPPRIEGWCGYIFKKKLLDDIIHYPHPSECYFVDDPWITSYFMDKGIKITRLFHSNVFTVSLRKTPKDVFQFLNNIFYKEPAVSGYNSKNPLWKIRKPDEDLKCTQVLHKDNQELLIQHNKTILENIRD